MSTPAQIAANRSNALKSTGPVTPEGKQRSAMNACNHGFYSQMPLLPNESEQEFIDFHKEMIVALAPADALQTVLARKIVHLSWVLKRIPELYVRVTQLKVEKRARLMKCTDPDPALAAVTAMLDDDHDTYSKLADHEARLLRLMLSVTRQLKSLQKNASPDESFLQNEPNRIEQNLAGASGTVPEPSADAAPAENEANAGSTCPPPVKL